MADITPYRYFPRIKEKFKEKKLYPVLKQLPNIKLFHGSPDNVKKLTKPNMQNSNIFNEKILTIEYLENFLPKDYDFGEKGVFIPLSHPTLCKFANYLHKTGFKFIYREEPKVFQIHSRTTNDTLDIDYLFGEDEDAIKKHYGNFILELVGESFTFYVVRFFRYNSDSDRDEYYDTFIHCKRENIIDIENLFKKSYTSHYYGGILSEYLEERDIDVDNFQENKFIITEEHQKLFDDLEKFYNNKEFYKTNRIPYKRGVLMAGAPGNGKTFSLQYIANKFKVPIIVPESISSPKNYITETFESAKRINKLTGKTPVIFMEEIDAVLSYAGGRELLLTALDGVENTTSFYFIATTNNPTEIDPALLNRPSRIDMVLTIENPNLEARHLFFSHIFTEWTEEQLTYLAKETKQFSFAFLKNIYINYVLTKGDNLFDESMVKKLAENERDHMKLHSNAISDKLKNKQKLGFHNINDFEFGDE